ncbi:MAG: nucleotide sugar dehydrogenase [Alphaproteobacteria bacterium]|nr:nucleotide sugar dehydrogenase [Alphaproteobacteria bacterium]
MSERIAVIGLGYVGLPVALGFARHFPTVGFDIDRGRVAELKRGHDRTLEVEPEVLHATKLEVSADPADLKDCTFFVVTVPTPIDDAKQPDLRPLASASRTVGAALKPGDVVVYESTVYPGVTEEFCAPILAEVSGLDRSAFRVGYSPERINPGDKQHTLERIVKVVSGEDDATLERVAAAYGRIIDAGIHRASSVKVAEAAKVIENTQRDLNIALMNELAVIFAKLGIRTLDVLEAAGTKWNFLPFRPGLVGGHCIGVDPYYLTAKATMVGHHPEVILAGRKTNDAMGEHVAQRIVKSLAREGHPIREARVGVLGLTFKENVPDLRNSRVPDILETLREYGIEPVVHDPFASPDEAMHEFGIELADLDAMQGMHALVLAVNHRQYAELGASAWAARLVERGVFFDVKSVFTADQLGPAVAYGSL